MSKHKMLQLKSIKTMAFDKKRWRFFADWLKLERENANLSQDGLADLVGVDRQTIYRLENALSGTRRETVIAISDALKANHSVALNKAGFAIQDEANISHEIEGVKISFDEKKIPKKEQERILDVVRSLAASAKADKIN